MPMTETVEQVRALHADGRRCSAGVPAGASTRACFGTLVQ